MFSKLLSGISGAVGAAVFVQFPAFYQQYLQRLGGQLDQSRTDVARFVEAGRQQGLDLKAYIQTLASNSDATVQGTATAIEGAVADLETNQSAFEALKSADVVRQPLEFARWFDSGVSTEVLNIFEPSLPLTLTGLVYAFIGVILGVLLLSIIWGILSGVGRFFYNRRSVAMMRDIKVKT